MYQYYKEHFLYNYDIKKINSVSYNYKSPLINFHIGSYANINCGDYETAKIVYRDMENRLKASGQFVKVRNYLINLSNIKNVKLEICKAYNEYLVVVEYKCNDSNILFCNDCYEAQGVYKYLVEMTDKYNTQNDNQVTNIEY